MFCQDVPAKSAAALAWLASTRWLHRVELAKTEKPVSRWLPLSVHLETAAWEPDKRLAESRPIPNLCTRGLIGLSMSAKDYAPAQQPMVTVFQSVHLLITSRAIEPRETAARSIVQRLVLQHHAAPHLDAGGDNGGSVTS